jgi:hypothetical protein
MVDLMMLIVLIMVGVIAGMIVSSLIPKTTWPHDIFHDDEYKWK